MNRRRLLTTIIAVAGAVLAILFFNQTYQHETARQFYDLTLVAMSIALVKQMKPARTTRREILRFVAGILIQIAAVAIFSSILVAIDYSDVPAVDSGWILLTHIPLAIAIAWSLVSLYRLGGIASWGRRSKSILIFAAFVLTLIFVGAPNPLLVILAIFFVLFLMPWSWIELLSGRDGWIILLLYVVTPLGFIIFSSGWDVNQSEGLTVSISTPALELLLSSRLLDWLADVVAFSWFAVPLKLTVAIFQGMFGIRIPIWLKFGTSYIFSTLIPGVLLVLLLALGVYVGIGSLRAQLVRDLILQDLQDLEIALAEDRLQGFANVDSVSSAVYRRVFPSATDKDRIPPPPNPFGSSETSPIPTPYETPELSRSESWQMYTRIDSLLGELGPLELWVKVKDASGNWSLPDTLSPFPGWTYTATARHGILPVDAFHAAFAAAYIEPGMPGNVKIAMRPMNQRALEPYKQSVRTDITLHPFGIIQMGPHGDDFSFQMNGASVSQIEDIKISTVQDRSTDFWHREIAHGVSELQSWSELDQTSTYVGTVVVHTSIAGLFAALYNWEGLNRIVIIVLIALSALFALAVLFSSLLAGGITRAVMKAVRELRQGTERLRKGDLDVQIKPRSHDELGDLAFSFNEMTSDLRRMISEVTVKERLEREIQIARRIQIHLLPTELPQRPTLRVGAHSDPAFEVGGDYYDCIDLGKRGLLVVLGDVSGKGVGAAVLMSNLQASLSLLATQGLSLHEMVHQLNLQVCKNSTPDMFITFFAALFDPVKNVMTYVNAGHDVPFIIRRSKPIDLEGGGMLLGIMEDAEFVSSKVKIEPGDLFTAYSDGLTEAMDEADEEFGRDRLIETLDHYKHLEPHMLVTQVLQTIRDYAGYERAGRDDLTLITVKVIES